MGGEGENGGEISSERGKEWTSTPFGRATVSSWAGEGMGAQEGYVVKVAREILLGKRGRGGKKSRKEKKKK